MWKKDQQEAEQLLPRRHDKEYDAVDRGESVREHHVHFRSEVLIHNDIRERKPKSGNSVRGKDFLPPFHRVSIHSCQTEWKRLATRKLGSHHYVNG
jgi:hypothetical protein